VCAVGYQWRALELLPTMTALLADQEVGLVVGASFGPTRARPWFVDREAGGGILLELASHDIDLHRALFGEIVAVQAAASVVPMAHAAVGPDGTPNAMSLVLHYARGGVGVSNAAWTRDGTPEVYFLQVAATDATLRLDLDPAFLLSGIIGGRTVAPRSITEYPFRRNIRGFLAAVREGGGNVYATAPDAARALTVALACERALASGATVEVPT
jgi:predicted dehydrogenase